MKWRDQRVLILICSVSLSGYLSRMQNVNHLSWVMFDFTYWNTNGLILKFNVDILYNVQKVAEYIDADCMY